MGAPTRRAPKRQHKREQPRCTRQKEKHDLASSQKRHTHRHKEFGRRRNERIRTGLAPPAPHPKTEGKDTHLHAHGAAWKVVRPREVAQRQRQGRTWVGPHTCGWGTASRTDPSSDYNQNEPHMRSTHHQTDHEHTAAAPPSRVQGERQRRRNKAPAGLLCKDTMDVRTTPSHVARASEAPRTPANAPSQDPRTRVKRRHASHTYPSCCATVSSRVKRKNLLKHRKPCSARGRRRKRLQRHNSRDDDQNQRGHWYGP